MDDLNFTPPWVRYPDAPSTWGGWRQGDSEPWFLAWLERYQALPPVAQLAYLRRWAAPEDWLEWDALRNSAQ